MAQNVKMPFLRLLLAICLLAGTVFALSVSVFAADSASSYAGCEAMTESGCAGGAGCQTTCGSDPTCVTSGTASATATQTKYTTGNTGASSAASDSRAAVGLAVAGGIIAAAVIGFVLLNRKPKRR